jgi:phosphoribosylformimino-5-aminoimidazole carboxamide ribotide isomerase
MEIIPAIDLIDGKCVRLTEGDFSQKTIYNESPVEVAKQFEAAGIRRLHLVDLDGAKAGKVVNWKVLEAITRETAMVVDFGGGIKTVDEVQRVFDLGAGYATIGSVAVKNEILLLEWFQKYGAEKFLVGADVKNEKLAIGGWLETTGVDIIDFIRKYMRHGIRQLFCTDVSKDGKLEGPSLDLYRKIIQHFPQLHFIASGGVSSMEDLYSLKEIGCKGVIVGKAIYENRITLGELNAMI